jgi:hypothetical protein
MSTIDRLDGEVFNWAKNQDIAISGVGPQSVEARVLVFVLVRTYFENRAPMTDISQRALRQNTSGSMIG